MPESDSSNGQAFSRHEAEHTSISREDLQGMVAIEAVGVAVGVAACAAGARTLVVGYEFANSADKLAVCSTGMAVAIGGVAALGFCGNKLKEYVPPLVHEWADLTRAWWQSRRDNRQQGSDTVQ